MTASLDKSQRNFRKHSGTYSRRVVFRGTTHWTCESRGALSALLNTRGKKWVCTLNLYIRVCVKTSPQLTLVPSSFPTLFLLRLLNLRTTRRNVHSLAFIIFYPIVFLNHHWHICVSIFSYVWLTNSLNKMDVLATNNIVSSASAKGPQSSSPDIYFSSFIPFCFFTKMFWIVCLPPLRKWQVGR